MSRLGRVAARVALRLHPGQWQSRFGLEVSGLIDDSDSSVADAADLARSALREQFKGGDPMRVERAHRHPRMLAAVAAILVTPTLVVVTASILGHELGITQIADLSDPFVAWIDTVRPIDLFLVIAPLAAFILAILPLLDLRIEHENGATAVAVRVEATTANLVVGGLALLLGAALVWHVVVESVLHAGA